MHGGSVAGGERPALACLAVGVVFTLAVVLSPELWFGLLDVELSVAMDTLDGCAASVVLALLLARSARTRRLQDTVLAEAVACLALASLVISTGGSLLGLGADRGLLWGEVLLRTFASTLFLGAALLPLHQVSVGLLGPLLRRGTALALVILPLLVARTGAGLPDPVPGLPSDPAVPEFEGHPALIALQVVSAASVLLAAWLFARQARGGDDPFVVWLAAAMVVLGISRVHYALYPSIYNGWIYTGDGLRTGGYLLLLVGAVAEIRAHFADRTRDAVEEERRRIARELHDGVTQELVLIRMETRPLIRDLDRTEPGEILAAVDRAEADTRAAIDALTLDTAAPLGREVARVAEETAARFGVPVRVDRLDDGVVDPVVRHEVLRIVREAVGNAARHGRPEEVRLSLARDGRRWSLRVEDDGVGFDRDRIAGGYGLTSMQERARALPGRLEVRSRPMAGATVELSW